MRRKLAAGNWKMNGTSAELARLTTLAESHGSAGCDVLICPPATLLSRAAEALSGSAIAVGGQDCHGATSGAHTGDISAGMLKDAGASHVILGHSERRADHGEGDALVRTKSEAAIAAGLTAVICLGESLSERDAGQTLDVIGTQLEGSTPDGASGARVVIAYEPVWAIGTGRTPTLEEVAAAHGHIRATLAAARGDASADIRLLYGGSMKPDNAGMLLAVENVDGGLIGGASLDAGSFLAIAAAAPA